jgi:hypothetical protein
MFSMPEILTLVKEEDREMNTRLPLIQHLDETRIAMRQALLFSEFEHARISRTIRHITSWDKRVLQQLESHSNSRLGDCSPRQDFVGTYANSDSSCYPAFSEIIREWETIRDQLKFAVIELSEGKFEEPIVFPWGGVGSIFRMIAFIAEHEREHAHALTHTKVEMGGFDARTRKLYIGALNK